MIIGLIYCLLFLITTALLPVADIELIHASWPGVYPNTYDNTVLCCLGFTIRDALSLSYASGRAFGGSYVLAFLFGALPILINVVERRMYNRSTVGITFLTLIFVLALCSFVPILIAADWGRYIYLGLTINFCCLWITDQSDIRGGSLEPLRSELKIERLVFIFLYATSWQTVHYRAEGNSAFIPGVLFRMLGETDLPRNVD